MALLTEPCGWSAEEHFGATVEYQRIYGTFGARCGQESGQNLSPKKDHFWKRGRKCPFSRRSQVPPDPILENGNNSIRIANRQASAILKPTELHRFDSRSCWRFTVPKELRPFSKMGSGALFAKCHRIPFWKTAITPADLRIASLTFRIHRQHFGGHDRTFL